MANNICGVDASNLKLDAEELAGGHRIQVDRTPEGIGRLLLFCVEHEVDLVVVEATGGLERLPFKLLSQGGLPCAVVNPRRVRQFAQSMGMLEKTDAIDARVIGLYARAACISPQPPPSETQEELTALVTRLSQLTVVKVSQENEKRTTSHPAALAKVEELLQLVRRQLRQLEGEIAELIEADPVWSRLNQAFREIKGVAGRTTARLLADMPEIGTLSGKACSKLAGLAPIARDSGTFNGQRRIKGGRTAVRCTLYVVAAVVAKHDPDLKAFRERLIKAGKPPKQVRIAVAHKLLVRLNAKARDARAELDLPMAA